MKLCVVCILPTKTRTAVDRALVEGETYNKIARRFTTKRKKVSVYMLCRHRKHLLPRDLVRQRPAPEPEVALSLIQRIENLVGDSKAIAHAAKSQQQWIAATSALREVRCCLELLGKLTGEITPANIFNLINFANVTDEQICAFLDALAERGDARAHELVMQRLGPPAPIFNVNFHKPPPALPEPFIDVLPPNSNGNA